tara:strand:- start:801 stop:956 length:156 start_codon:yes stop_codon:yes gene_type:complete
MEKNILSWVKLYQSKCQENKRLKAEVDILQEILHSYLIVIDGKDNTNNENG